MRKVRLEETKEMLLVQLHLFLFMPFIVVEILKYEDLLQRGSSKENFKC